MSCDDIIIEVPEEVIVIEMTPEGADGKSLNPRGDWNSSAVYAYRDMVAYQGNSYIALKNVPAGTLPTDTEYWMINAAGGNTTYWGNIHGTLSNQTDLVTALASKADANTVYTKTEADALLSNKADADSVYTKTEADTLLDAKADVDSVYTKTEADALLDEKADASSVYTKTETDDLLDLKADKADVYTQAELDGIFDGIDNALDTKAGASDVYTKTQTDNLLADKADADDVYTKAEADALLGDKADSDDVYTKTETDDLLSAKTNSADLGALASKDTVDYDTEVTNKPTLGTMAAENAADYYTETEVDTLLSAKANSADLGTMSAESASDYYDKTDTDALLSEKADIIHSSASGALVHLTDAGAYPVDALTVGIEPVQDLHGYDAPWPAGGGKNLYPNSIISGTENSFTVTQDGDKYVLSATNQTTYAQRISSETISLKAGTYTSSLFGGPDSSITFQLRSLDGLTTYTYTALGGRPHTFTLAEDTVVKPRFTSNKTGSFTYTATVQIEQGSTATSYAPYSNICPISGHSEAHIYHEVEYDADADPKITIDLDGTRYGAQLNVLTGEMTVDRAYALLNDPDKWIDATGNILFKYNQEYTDRKLLGNSYDGLSCSYIQVNINNSYNTGRWQSADSYYFGIKNSNLTLNQIKTDASAGKIAILYELATPLTVQLTANTLSLLLGENNIWVDTGDTAVGYRADTKRYIDSKLSAAIAELQALILEH